MNAPLAYTQNIYCIHSLFVSIFIVNGDTPLSGARLVVVGVEKVGVGGGAVVSTNKVGDIISLIIDVP